MQQWTFIDKSKWPKGEWNKEPDKVFFTDEKTGYPCIALRQSGHGGWCGYVGVPPTHPWFGIEYSEPLKKGCAQEFCWDENCCPSPDKLLHIHGGITFAKHCQEDKELGVCHKSDTDAFWFGFDCAHCDDFSPGYQDIMNLRDTSATYKDLDYVKNQIKDLAKQLKAYE